LKLSSELEENDTSEVNAFWGNLAYSPPVSRQSDWRVKLNAQFARDGETSTQESQIRRQ
jgi:hypothetical protein